MAFEVPNHLPRGGVAQDRPTLVLTKLGQATAKTLTANVAGSWLAELDSAIQDTKNRISQRIQDDLPAFERQFKSSTSIQMRLNDLSTTVDELQDDLDHPKTGILPTLLNTLTAHKTLSEQASDLDVTCRALEHLLRIQLELDELSVRVRQGELTLSAETSVRAQKLITEAPDPLNKAEVMSDIKKTYRTLNDYLQEQLSDAYTRSILFSTSADMVTLSILPFTKVPPTSTNISLAAIFQSIAADFLSTRLSMFRRDLMTKLVDPILLSSYSATTSTSDSSSTFSILRSSTPSTPLEALEALMTFINSCFIPHLPLSQGVFLATFHGPITLAVLNHVLKPSIPLSLAALPSFLTTVDDAVRFEDSLLSSDAKDRPIRYWVDDVASHYEKKRRETLFLNARAVINAPEEGTPFRIEVMLPQSPAKTETASPAIDETNGATIGWDFDDGKPEGSANTLMSHPSLGTEETGEDGEDTSDGWGWGDDVDEETDAGVIDSLEGGSREVKASNQEEDDPWDDDGWSTEPPSPQPFKLDPEPSSSVLQSAPKMATRLEKHSAKAKGLSVPNAPTASPLVAQVLQPPPPSPPTQQPPSRPPKTESQKKETYLVSLRAKKILEIAENAMREGQELLHSNIFVERSVGKSLIPGQLLVTAAPSVLDLYRALYPIIRSDLLAHDSNLAMRWTNDCRFLSGEVTNLRQRYKPAYAEDRWAETGDRLQMLGDVCFEDAVVQQQDAVRHLLTSTQGFVEVSERLDECKSSMEQVLKRITAIAGQWKETLTKKNYFHAMGRVVDDALFRVMDSILALQDIPEADSERLSELCETLAPLEELFVYDPGEESVIGSHVPLWFKFSYLSWLIKGSIADISYLFDQGMLVDYEIDELVGLLRALFAETPLREKTITKILKRQPLPSYDNH
ncbi:hypothetical protein K439DRAFT_1635009 [Ramaria rubella]|nr:hypothetical protein K439DRAFT_1635009 [Ramaria rubella]